jgi:hypothetical protein
MMHKSGAFVPGAGSEHNRMLEHRPVEHPQWEYDEVATVGQVAPPNLAELGRDGWEVISVTRSAKGRVYFLKRPVRQGPVVERRG